MTVEERNKLMEQASDFCAEGDCFIHTEMRGGKRPETILSGDMEAMLWGICAEIDRIGEKTGIGFDKTLAAVNLMQKLGYKEVKQATSGIPKRKIEGAPAPEDVEGNLRVKIADLTAKLKEAEKEAIREHNLATDVKKKYSSIVKEKDKKIIELSKELTAAEHNVDELIEYINKMRRE